MPTTIAKSTDGTQIIGGAFSNQPSVFLAVEELRKLGYSGSDTRVISKENEITTARTTNIDGVEKKTTLIEDGVAKSQAEYYVKAIDSGKTVILVYNVSEPGPVIDTFDRLGADYNPNGQRNLRQDVAEMTVGAIAGATALGALGGVVAGPVGLAAGVSGGLAVGAALGAATGKEAEHRK